MKCELKLLKGNTVKALMELRWKGWLGVLGFAIVGYLLCCMCIEAYLVVVALALVLSGLAYYDAHQKCRGPRK